MDLLEFMVELLFGFRKYDAIYTRIRYHISIRSRITCDSLPIEKGLTLHNVIILIKSVLNKDQDH